MTRRRKQKTNSAPNAHANGRRQPRAFMPRRRNMDLAEQAGQILIAGVAGASLSAEERAWFHRIGATPLLRCVDLEGGLVARLRDVIAPTPSASAVFATGRRNLFRQHGLLIAREARALGFNTVFAPVLDLALPESASILRTRVVSAAPWRVIDYARGFLSGMHKEDILACGKHFPGLGGGTVDSHQSMPVIHRMTRLMWRSDLAPWL